MPSLFTARNLLPVLALWLVWMMAHAGLLVQFAVPLTDALPDALLFAGLLALSCWVIGIVLHYYRPDLQKTTRHLAGISLLTLGITSLYRLIAEEWLKPGSRIIDHSEHAFSILFVVSFLLLSLFSLYYILHNALQEQEADAKRKAGMEQLLRDAELAGLRQQLQPHFLFNSLNSVSALVEHDPQEARRMLHLLSDFLRGTVRKDIRQHISLEEELKHLNLYLQIEQVRFAQRLHVTIDAEEAVKHLQIPSLLLQPLIENAIKFGLYGTTGPTDIGISATRNGSMLEVRIRNPYDATTDTLKKGTGFGLSSVERRLFLLFGRTDLLETQAGRSHFTTIVRIPQST